MNKFSPYFLRGKEMGKRVFILGNSPSILLHDLSKLNGKLSIGMNASTLLEKKYGFISSYYCVSDKRFLSDIEKKHMATNLVSKDTVRVLRSGISEDEKSKLHNKTIYIDSLGRDGFSFDLASGFYFGSTTTMLAIQLAVWLGCIEIVLLGCDFNYKKSYARFYSESKIAPDDALISVQVRNIANSVRLLKERGVSVFNCSVGSMLRSYVKYEKFENFVN